jgi:hypothetical protein
VVALWLFLVEGFVVAFRPLLAMLLRVAALACSCCHLPLVVTHAHDVAAPSLLCSFGSMASLFVWWACSEVGFLLLLVFVLVALCFVWGLCSKPKHRRIPVGCVTIAGLGLFAVVSTLPHGGA